MEETAVASVGKGRFLSKAVGEGADAMPIWGLSWFRALILILGSGVGDADPKVPCPHDVMYATCRGWHVFGAPFPQP